MFILKNVQYKAIIAVDELHIPAQKTTCIVGESGGGKSTLIRLLNQLISCDKGEIFYKNQPIHTLDPIQLRREVVMIPQAPVIFDGTVKDNLLIGLTFSGKPLAGENELTDVLTTVCLEKELAEPAGPLSGGEQQRLSLARALLMNPEVYIFDEPTSALDEETEKKVMDNVVGEVKRKRKTLIIVTHSKKVAQTYADVVIEMKNGSAATVKKGVKKNG
ncbi:putative ABC transport system ATP-binding protein [Evansella caseinilytica]|uniref:Putative ABC transport system ATP-binding protein n=1 Tax=Evansella caseinilytica TaxID=1503961 RepID=A0A1H3QBD0_9BACI|nr:ABC transporter ATP-binding protein [Evansella caseinilytica]SDZ10325.1 putative ABC transport system ATP-binding protein [Evansella caseinilytica]